MSTQIQVRGAKLNRMLFSLDMELEKKYGIIQPCSPLAPASLLQGLLGGRGQQQGDVWDEDES